MRRISSLIIPIVILTLASPLAARPARQKKSKQSKACASTAARTPATQVGNVTRSSGKSNTPGGKPGLAQKTIDEQHQIQ